MTELPIWNFLVIDDDPGDIRILEWHLREIDDCEIELAAEHDIERAVVFLAAEAVDLVFLDYHLGCSDGIESLQRIKAAGFEGPILMLSGRGDEHLAVEVLREGAADYLPKRSISTESLRRAVGNALHKAKLEGELEAHRESLERSNADLLRRSHEIETFYHTLSHELKTPLTSVREFTSILLDGLAGDLLPEQRQHLEIVLEGCEQMRLFLDDILDASRLETGKLAVDLAQCDLSHLLRRTITSLSLQIQQAGVEFEVSGLEGLPQVRADEHRIVQVLNNLIGNALKYTPRGGQIRVQVRPLEADDFVEVQVQDTGCGIGPGHLPRVFDRLFQVSESDTSTHGGLGLGLNICKGIIDLHGGEIHASSEPSVGSRFIFTLPCFSGATGEQPIGDVA